MATNNVLVIILQEMTFTSQKQADIALWSASQRMVYLVGLTVWSAGTQFGEDGEENVR